MRLVLGLSLVAALAGYAFLPATTVSTSAKEASQSEKYVPGEILVKFRSEESLARSASVHERFGATVKREFAELGWQHVRLPEGTTVEEALSAYRSESEIAAAQPNFIYKINVTPNDAQWNTLYGMVKIHAPEAWATTTGSPQVIVAVIDTGIEKFHEDLADNVWQNPGEIAGNGVDDDANGYVDDTIGYDFLNLDSDPADGNEHGTHCSGTIGGVGNNGIGVAGVNWNVKVMALKTHTDEVGASTSATVISAFQYVTMMKNRGVNIRATSNSYGGPPEAGTYDQAMKDAIDAAGRADVLNVFAAGNQLTVDQENDNDVAPTYPGSYNSPSILAVAASDQNDNVASFSHYGLTTVDVAAPGVSIRSTVPGNAYANLSGTSMSTPHVAGAAALLAAAHPGLSAASLRATLMNTVDVLPQWAGLISTGGRINVARAIVQPTVCTFTTSASGAAFSSSGGNGTFAVSAPANCGAYAFPDKPWIVVTSDPTNGSGIVSYTVLPNSGAAGRSGTLSIGGQMYTITQAPLAPTAAKVYVEGRVMKGDGTGLPTARVSMVAANGEVRNAITNAFGYYRFEDIEAGDTYNFFATAKGYTFDARTMTVADNVSGADFVAR